MLAATVRHNSGCADHSLGFRSAMSKFKVKLSESWWIRPKLSSQSALGGSDSSNALRYARGHPLPVGDFDCYSLFIHLSNLFTMI